MTSQDHCTRELGGRNGSGCIDSRAKRLRHKVKIFFTSAPCLHMWCRVTGSALNIGFPQHYLQILEESHTYSRKEDMVCEAMGRSSTRMPMACRLGTP